MDVFRQASPQVRDRVTDTVVDMLTSPAVTKATEHHLQRFGTLLEPNPRAMKRFVNDYSMLRAVRTVEGNPVRTDPLALWAIVEIRWPALAQYLRTRPEAIELLEDRTSNLDDVPSELCVLFKDPNVRKLASFEHGGPLTPELIRACCGGAPSE